MAAACVLLARGFLGYWLGDDFNAIVLRCMPGFEWRLRDERMVCAVLSVSEHEGLGPTVGVLFLAFLWGPLLVMFVAWFLWRRSDGGRSS